MKTEYHPFTVKELETRRWPLTPTVIPNYMGINLCSVEGMSWTRQKDGQLVGLTIHFEPADVKPVNPDKIEQVKPGKKPVETIAEKIERYKSIIKGYQADLKKLEQPQNQ